MVDVAIGTRTVSRADGYDTDYEDLSGGCNGTNSGFYDAAGQLNVCIYGNDPSPEPIQTLPTIQVTPSPGELAAAGVGNSADIGTDALASGLAAYSTATDRLLELNGIAVRGLPGVISHLPAGVGGAIGVLETAKDARDGNTLAAFQDSGATIGGVIVGDLSAGLCASTPFSAPIAPVCAVAGGLAGAAVGRAVGGIIYGKMHPINAK